MVCDYQGEEVKKNDRVLLALALGVLREGLVVDVRPNGHVVVQFSVSIMSDLSVIPPDGCIRIPNP
jgi:hypothetical protein